MKQKRATLGRPLCSKINPGINYAEKLITFLPDFLNKEITLALIDKADDLGAVPKTFTLKSTPLEISLLVAVFLAVFLTFKFLNLIFPP